MLDFSVDELDDLRLAVVEAVTWLVGPDDAEVTSSEDDPGTVVFGFHADADTLRIVGRAPMGSGDGTLDDLSHAILGATVDSYDLETGDRERTITLTKTRP